jgi:hypothetical protein
MIFLKKKLMTEMSMYELLFVCGAFADWMHALAGG